MKDTTDGDGCALKSQKRLAALDSLSLMDSPPEEIFDRAVRLATRMLGVEVGLLSLVDGERQFFKAQIGLPAPYAESRETPLSHSFCQHVVRGGAPLMVRDAREDPVLQSNLAIRDLNVIAYLGVPVRATDGEVLGSFCAIEGKPRDWTNEERAILDDIAAGIESELAFRTESATRSAQVREQRAMRQRLDLALQSGSMGTYDLNLETGVAEWDDQLYEIWRLPVGSTNPFEAAVAKIHPEDMDAHEAAFAKAMDPAGDGLYRLEMRVLMGPSEDYIWVLSTGIVTFDSETPTRMVGTVQDISDRKRAEEHALLLSQELNHRVKNLFAITNGIISITARESKTTREMADALRSRIVSLSSAHDLVRPAIARDHNAAAETDLATLMQTILAPHLQTADQAELTGDFIALGAEQASSYALVLHELATNAAKYGALTGTDGRVKIEWRVNAGTLSLNWFETGGPQTDQTNGTAGFGSTLIDLTVKRQLFGDYEIERKPEGFCFRMTLPWS
ncbi:GAF domain-containing protein [Yoonia sp. BS5-3]|uniref:histidine kinase n=1 Tax=Yoonia phaeophyticola TaxID=3137369 RepID=A0ABZ2UYP6_9RHOB